MTNLLKCNRVICGDSAQELKKFPDECIDLTVTSPPYDDLRDYEGYSFDFESIAKELYRITKQGGIIVWIVKDKHKNHNETGTSFKQALFFKRIGFNLYDTMIYNKETITFPHPRIYHDAFEYMFILSKGKPKTVNLIHDRKNKCGGQTTWGNKTQREKNGTLTNKGKKIIKDFGRRYNVWTYLNGKGHTTKDEIAFKHPAIMNEKLTTDHIKSWSNKNDIVLDCFAGSGTTLKMAKILNRNFIGIEISEKYVELINKRISSIQMEIVI